MVIDTDGSAFITKAEFDSLKNSFQAQIDNYNSSIDSKIDGAIAAYLSGVATSSSRMLENIYVRCTVPGSGWSTPIWSSNSSWALNTNTDQLCSFKFGIFMYAQSQAFGSAAGDMFDDIEFGYWKLNSATKQNRVRYNDTNGYVESVTNSEYILAGAIDVREYKVPQSCSTGNPQASFAGAYYEDNSITFVTSRDDTSIMVGADGAGMKNEYRTWKEWGTTNKDTARWIGWCHSHAISYSESHVESLSGTTYRFAPLSTTNERYDSTTIKTASFIKGGSAPASDFGLTTSNLSAAPKGNTQSDFVQLVKPADAGNFGIPAKTKVNHFKYKKVNEFKYKCCVDQCSAAGAIKYGIPACYCDTKGLLRIKVTPNTNGYITLYCSKTPRADWGGVDNIWGGKSVDTSGGYSKWNQNSENLLTANVEKIIEINAAKDDYLWVVFLPSSTSSTGTLNFSSFELITEV